MNEQQHLQPPAENQAQASGAVVHAVVQITRKATGQTETHSLVLKPAEAPKDDQP